MMLWKITPALQIKLLQPSSELISLRNIAMRLNSTVKMETQISCRMSVFLNVPCELTYVQGYCILNWKNAGCCKSVSINNCLLPHKSTWIPKYVFCCAKFWVGNMKGSCYYEAGGSRIFSNVGVFLPNYTASVQHSCHRLNTSIKQTYQPYDNLLTDVGYRPLTLCTLRSIMQCKIWISQCEAQPDFEIRSCIKIIG